ncbi:MAG TPA: hypothetical protein VER58_19135 [Thermoanaerobaculia bacterium]|nr:hypothetical protein [Thermoanaerobaculia bacterium]
MPQRIEIGKPDVAGRLNALSLSGSFLVLVALSVAIVDFNAIGGPFPDVTTVVSIVLAAGNQMMLLGAPVFV